MATALRTFVDTEAVRVDVPLLLGIVSCSGGGKTFSALRLATGMQQVIGGDIFVIDTEHNRALNYADLFKFRHIPFEPPFGTLDYLRAIEYCYNKGGKIIIIDSMTHEHSGQGGYLDSAEQFILAKIKSEPDNARRYNRPPKSERDIREKNSRTKWIHPAADRKSLTNGIVQMGINGIFCYRAQEKLNDDFKPLGWEPETTSRLIYEMQQQFLLLPGSDGIPKIDDATASEKRLIKTPAQFRDWFKQGQRLDEAMGVKMAQWAAGSKVPTSPPSSYGATKSDGAGGGAVLSKVSATPSQQGSPVNCQEDEPSSERAGNVGASGPAESAPNDKTPPAAWQISFFNGIAQFKKANESEYYRILGAHGYEHANQVPTKTKALEIYEEMKGAIQCSLEKSR